MDERLAKIRDQVTKVAGKTASKARSGIDGLVEKNRDRLPDRVEQLYDKVAKKTDDED
jgi:ElaB/YqjD/DUF883 family membrane-anchored ribosome-binding protein